MKVIFIPRNVGQSPKDHFEPCLQTNTLVVNFMKGIEWDLNLNPMA